MNFNNVYEDILKSRFVTLDCDAEEKESFYELVRRIYEAKWLRCPDTINKKEIHRKLTAAIQELDYSHLFRRVANRKRWVFPRVVAVTRQIPLWEAFLGSGILHYGRGFDVSQMRDALVQAALEKIGAEEMGHLTEEKKQQFLPAMTFTLSSVIGFLLLYHFRRTLSLSKCLSLEPAHSLMELTLQGQGLLFCVSMAQEGWDRIELRFPLEVRHAQVGTAFRETGRSMDAGVELRLPVWGEKDAPVNIVEDEESSYVQVTLLRGSAYVPELVWRTPERLKHEDIFLEPNLEVRRAMVEVIGNERFLRHANARVIDERDGLKLYSVTMGNIPFNLVQCVCPSTLHVYYLRVPPNITDANTAIAWTFGETKDNYRPERET